MTKTVADISEKMRDLDFAMISTGGLNGGSDTPGLMLIKVHGGRVHYWDGEDEGEVLL